MNHQLLELVQAECINIGLSEKTIGDLVTIGSHNLEESATKQDIQQQADQILTYAKALQSENASSDSNEADISNKTEDSQNDQVKDKPWQKDIQTFEEKYKAELLALKQENETLKTEKEQQQRESLISKMQHKHGISSEDMKYVAIPKNSDIEKFFIDYKQHLITRGLMPADAAGMQLSTQQASQELAKTLLSEIEVKS